MICASALSALSLMKIKWFLILASFLLVLFLIDIYCYRSIKILKKENRLTIKSIYWVLSLFIYIYITFLFLFPSIQRSAYDYKKILFIFGLFSLWYFPKLILIVFQFLRDFLYLILYQVSSVFKLKVLKIKLNKLNYLIKIGFILTTIPLILIIYGMNIGLFNFKIYQENIYFQNLPNAFDGLKIVLLSDIHIGGFYGHEDEVIKAINMVNSQNPDLIVFTGDMVSNYAEELDGWQTILSKLKAKEGMFSILGNHDYGDYYKWKNAEDKISDSEKIKKLQKSIGFRLLLNESETLSKDGDTIAIIGVENFGRPPFFQYCDLNKAMKNSRRIPFKILLSHNPNQWMAEVTGKTDIALTLSGHTHGMQMGIEWGNTHWSPAKYIFPRWAGLYQSNQQYLYVNRGLGFVGLPARIGMPAEITVLTLHKK